MQISDSASSPLVAPLAMFVSFIPFYAIHPSIHLIRHTSTSLICAGSLNSTLAARRQLRWCRRFFGRDLFGERRAGTRHLVPKYSTGKPSLVVWFCMRCYSDEYVPGLYIPYTPNPACNWLPPPHPEPEPYLFLMISSLCPSEL